MKIMIFLIGCLAVFGVSFAQQGRWADRGSTPFQVFENVVGGANTGDKIQETYLDTISDAGGENPQFKITNTLSTVRGKLGPYIQWAVYVGLVASTAGLIICGFIMVTGGVSKSSGFDKIKTKVINALLGVFILSGFYVIIKLMVGAINMFFGD